MKMSPADTRHSLLASAVAVPCRTASSVGLSPATPTIAAITQSAGRLAASSSASSPLDASAGERSAKCRVAGWLRNHGELSAMQNGELGEPRGIVATSQSHNLMSPWIATDEVERALADGAGRT